MLAPDEQPAKYRLTMHSRNVRCGHKLIFRPFMQLEGAHNSVAHHPSNRTCFLRNGTQVIQIIKLSLVTAILVSPALVLAHSGATGIVKERMEIMKDVGAVMKELGAMVKGKVEFDAVTVAKRGRDLKSHAASIPALFPANSIHGPSEALPTIWENFEAFSQIASNLESAAVALSGVTKSSALPAALGAAGRTCKACHTDYRKP